MPSGAWDGSRPILRKDLADRLEADLCGGPGCPVLEAPFRAKETSVASGRRVVALFGGEGVWPACLSEQ